jgi:hypothetical protein
VDAGGTYDGTTQFAATVTVTGAGTITGSPTLTYHDNTRGIDLGSTPPINAGNYTATAIYSGDTTHTGSSGTATFDILKAPSATTTAGAGPSGIFAVGAGPGGLPLVDVYDATTGAFRLQFQAFDTGFTGGVRVAVGRLHGQDIIVAAAGPGGWLVRTFAVGPTGVTPIAQFEPFGTFTGGIWAALGDLNGDGNPEIVTGADADPNGYPLVNVHDLNGNQISPNILAFEEGFHGGVRVAVADLNGDGKAEIIGSAGAGGLPLVQLINGQTFQREARFQVFDAGFGGGVFVTGAVLDASGMARLVVSADGGDGSPFDEPVLREYDGTGALLHDYVSALEAPYHGGIDVTATRAFGRTFDSLLVGPVSRHLPAVTVLDENFNALSSRGFRVLDPQTKAVDAVFANGLNLG